MKHARENFTTSAPDLLFIAREPNVSRIVEPDSKLQRRNPQHAANAVSVRPVETRFMEDVMRITVKLDGFEGAPPAAYAILWLDKETRRWSREGHQSVDVPDWGGLGSAADGTLICHPHEQQPVCKLEELDVEAPGGPPEGVAGRVLWYAEGASNPRVGRWHVQCVDRAQIKAEHSVFAGDEYF
ncbi:DUF3564 family protein [Caballeronia sp. GAWG1-5s-s]|uniref:DUF3564 family protein n=1 Tax=Caballeronia sp. GAWG1-5s-s TaxID=2921743 RepID=UPI0032EC0A94